MPQAAPPVHSCDVLVLGAGLAGMRAAAAAKEAAPASRVLLVSPRRAPSGSSFANRNNALGMQAPSESEAPAFVDEVLRLAPPGTADAALVHALAADAPAMLAELLNLGLDLRREADGSLSRFPGCFSAVPRAVIFTNLAGAHAAFTARAKSLGVEFLHGCEALALLKNAGGRVCGARLAALRGATQIEVRARTVVAALGGPAPLYARRTCGPGGSGLGLGLLRSAGAELVNARYLQFFWLRARSGAFVNPGGMSWADPELAALAAARRGHCPMSHGQPDARLDHALLALREADGLVRRPEYAGGEPLALFAHAGNGGAHIDCSGRTTAAGLFACGECAGGMHGADRMGGAMVLACLVFGARAGAAAAREAAGTPEPRPEPSPPLPEPNGESGRDLVRESDALFLQRLRRGMERNGLPGQKPGGAFLQWLNAAAARADAPRRRLLALSALAVLGAPEQRA